jgi:hypothetical protein
VVSSVTGQPHALAGPGPARQLPMHLCALVNTKVTPSFFMSLQAHLTTFRDRGGHKSRSYSAGRANKPRQPKCSGAVVLISLSHSAQVSELMRKTAGAQTLSTGPIGQLNCRTRI